ncbi:hypothetical protein [Frankia sp. AgB32]|uniref:hypothetical protein n=1 Tax=Frankia sp. AgB32 TaxID=631119 RepID=UPI00200ECB08|nr:hypothetical protein [Frankia sp. AgB32]MCK9897897.1 hypothetical protein [Frankia sp. AgB32]
MTFWAEFESCMHGSGLPTPAEALNTAGEVIEFLDKVNHAAAAAGGMEVTLGALEGAGFTGFGGLAADVAAVTVSFYAGACAGCLVGAGGSTIWDSLAQVSPSPDVRDLIVTAANEAGLASDRANA